MRTPRSSWKSAPRWSRRRRSRSPAACSPSAALGPDARPGLTGQQVRDAWRTIAAATHPDRPDSGDPDAYAAVSAAYAALRTPWARSKAYADLTARTVPAVPPGRRPPPRRRTGRTLRAVLAAMT